jgi:hypothetical protein
MTGWARLRQVVFASDHLERDGWLLAERLRLGPGFADPERAAIGMADDTRALAAGSYLELVGALPGAAPNSGGAWLARWVEKAGPGGYGLSVQFPDPGAAVARARSLGIRIVADQDVRGCRIVQFHPSDVGLLLELDGIADPNAWFWDSFGARAAAGALVDDIVAVEVPVEDPVTIANRWHALLDLGDSGADTTIWLGDRPVRFVPAAGGPRRWAVTLRRSADSNLADEVLLGVQLRYV